MTLESRVKAEAYELLGLDSLKYESMSNGAEYTHYLSLSHSISELIRLLVSLGSQNPGQKRKKQEKELIPCPGVSLHCHEFGVFYAPARLKKLGIPTNSVANPACHSSRQRMPDDNSIQKRRNNDSTWPPGVPENLASLEALAMYADMVTAVGESTRQEARLFYGINGIVIRNGITIESEKIDWSRKELYLAKIQSFPFRKPVQVFTEGKRSSPERSSPFSQSLRIEVENKGYPDLLDSLVALEHIIRNSIMEGHMEEGIKGDLFPCGYGRP